MKHLYSRLALITSTALVFGYLIVSATWTPTTDVTSGQLMSAELWNGLLANMNDLNGRIGAVGSVWTSGASDSINYTAGSVGIGTTEPQRELHIKSSNGAQIQLQ